MPREKRKLSVPQVAREYGVSEDKIRRWIAQGELRAFNAATRPGGRPRWLIDLDDLRAFEARRAASAHVTAPTPRRRKAADIIEFF
jgi:excisionase family DNA binding protein